MDSPAGNETSVGPALSKKYSEASSTTLHTLDNLDNAFAQMAQRVANLDKVIDPNNLDSIVAAKNDLAQIIGDLEKLQFNKVGSPSFPALAFC